MRLPTISYLLLFFLITVTFTSAAPTTAPGTALSVRSSAEVDNYPLRDSDVHINALSRRQTVAATMIYYGSAPIGMAGAYLMSQDQWALGAPLLSTAVIGFLVQSGTATRLWRMELDLNVLKLRKDLGEYKHAELYNQYALEKAQADTETSKSNAIAAKLAAHEAQLRYERLLEILRLEDLKRQAEEAQIVRDARDWERKNAEENNKLWITEFRTKLKTLEKCIGAASTGREALQNATKQSEYATDTSHTLEDRQKAEKLAEEYFERAQKEVNDVQKTMDKLVSAVKDNKDLSLDFLENLNAALEKEFQVTESSGSTRRWLSQGRQLPRHIGQMDQACNDEFCPQLWYSTSPLRGRRRDTSPLEQTHDFFFLPRDYTFETPHTLARRGQPVQPVQMFSSEDCSFEEDVGDLKLYGILSLRQGKSTSSALILSMMGEDEYKTRFMEGVYNIPNITSNGMTFSSLDRPGVHCLYVGTEDYGAAVQGVYISSSDHNDVTGDMSSYHFECEAKLE